MRIRSRSGAFVALGVLTVVWGFTWIALKVGLSHTDAVSFTVHRSMLGLVVMFAILLLQRKPLRPPPWTAVLVTGLFQTTLNFGGTALALTTGGGAGRTSVLVFTMPFWTLLLAWPIFQERIRGSQWVAIFLALAGLVLVVDPVHWSGSLTPKLWAVLSGIGWAGGTIAMKYFGRDRDRDLDLINFVAWQMLVGSIPFFIVPLVHELPPTQWSLSYCVALFAVAVLSSALAFVVWVEILRFLPAGTASLNTFAVPVIALLSSMVIFGEHLAANEWAGIVCIGAGLAVLAVRALRMRRG